MADDDSRGGARYADGDILAWADAMHAPQDPGLKRAFDAPQHTPLPAIQVGRSEGRFLELICRLAQVKKAVEVGTLAGFSAIHLARALPADGHLWTVEYAPLHAQVARDNLAAAGLADRVTVVMADGPTGLAQIEAEGPFDAVFIDADKGRYDVYGRWAARHLRAGGLLLADNAYYFGKLLDAAHPEAAAVRRLHEEAAEHFDAVCLPTPDGLLLGVRR
jgi:caffeoyl-CoA O-methyltransferase